MRLSAVTAVAFLACLFALMPQAAGAGSITLTPTSQAPGGTVSVTGSGFGATSAVGIGFGAAQPITGEIVIHLVNGTMWDYNFTHLPLKPGSISIHEVRAADGYEEWAEDNGAGELRLIAGNLWGTVNYASGSYHREGATTVADRWTFTASYTCYQYNVTSFGSIITTASGAFSANFTVPAVANGNYNVTVIDAGGNVAFATLNVSSAIPEGLPLGAILLLSSVAVVASSWHFRARAKK
jgi:hypothetical protein